MSKHLRFGVILILFTLISVPGALISGGKPIEVTKNFTLFTSKNMQGYTKPFFTTIGQSWNSDNFTSARYDEYWNFAFDISAMGMIIPDGQKSFSAELPEGYANQVRTATAAIMGADTMLYVHDFIDQPTIYGGQSTAVFSSPQTHNPEDSLLKSVAFAEGNQISMMAGIPTIQFAVGIPTRTQLRFRFLYAPMGNDYESISYFGVMLNQQVDHFVDLFGDDKTMGLAFNFAYHALNQDPSIEMNAYSIGMHFSKSWENGFTLYTGLQYENLSGEFWAKREDYDPNDVANSPYDEVRAGRDIKFDIETFTNYRFTGGAAYRYGIMELHLDGAIASQPQMSFGITLWFFQPGKDPRIQEKIEQYEEIERIEKTKKSETK